MKNLKKLKKLKTFKVCVVEPVGHLVLNSVKTYGMAMICLTYD